MYNDSDVKLYQTVYTLYESIEHGATLVCSNSSLSKIAMYKREKAYMYVCHLSIKKRVRAKMQIVKDSEIVSDYRME
jgi:hypothetical protein